MAALPESVQPESVASPKDTSAFMGFLEDNLFPEPPVVIPTPEVESGKVLGDQAEIAEPPAPIQDGVETKMATASVKVHRRPPKPYGAMGLRRGSSQSATRAEGPAKRPKTRSAVETGDRSAVQVLPLCAGMEKAVKPKRYRSQVHLVYGDRYDTHGESIDGEGNRREDMGPEVPLHHIVPVDKPLAAPSLVNYEVDNSGDDDAFGLHGEPQGERQEPVEEVTLFSPPVPMLPRRWERQASAPKTPVAETEPSGMDVEVSPVVGSEPPAVEVVVRVERDQDGNIDRETVDKVVSMGLQRAASIRGDCDLVARIQPRRTSLPNLSPIRTTGVMARDSDILPGLVTSSTPLVGVAPLGRGRVEKSADLSVEERLRYDTDWPPLSRSPSPSRVVASPVLTPDVGNSALSSVGGAQEKVSGAPEWFPGLGVAQSSDEEVLQRGPPVFATPTTPSKVGTPLMPPPSHNHVPKAKVSQERTAPTPGRVFRNQAAFSGLMASQPEPSPKWRQSPIQEARLMGRTLWKDGHVMPMRVSVNMVYTDPNVPKKTYVVRLEDGEHLCDVLFIEEEQWRRLVVTDADRAVNNVPDDIIAILPADFPKGLAGAHVVQIDGGKMMAALGAQAFIQVKVAKQGKIDTIRKKKSEAAAKRDAEAARTANDPAARRDSLQREGPRRSASRLSTPREAHRRTLSSPPVTERVEKLRKTRPKETVKIAGQPRADRRGSSSGFTDEDRERRHRGKGKDKRKSKHHPRQRSPVSVSSEDTSDLLSDDSNSSGSSDGTPKVAKSRKVRPRRSRSPSQARPSSQLERTIVGVMERLQGLPTAAIRPRGLHGKIEPYTGEPVNGKLAPFKVWAGHAKLKMNGMGITADADLVAQLPLILNGKALEEFETLTDREKKTYERCIDALDRLLTPGGLGSAAAVDAFMNRRQEAGETVVQFCRALKLLAERAYPDQNSRARDKMVKTMLVRGLPRKFRRDVAKARPKTLKLALEMAKEFEMGCNEYLDGDSSDSDPPKPRRSKAAAKAVATVNAVSVTLPTPLPPDRAKSNSETNLNTSGAAGYGNQRQSGFGPRRDDEPYQFPGKCWNCMEIGHRQTDCPRPRQMANTGGQNFRGGRGGGGYRGGGGRGFHDNRQQNQPNQQPAWLSGQQCQRLFNAFMESRAGEFGYSTTGGLPLTGGNAEQLGTARVLSEPSITFPPETPKVTLSQPPSGNKCDKPAADKGGGPTDGIFMINTQAGSTLTAQQRKNRLEPRAANGPDELGGESEQNWEGLDDVVTQRNDGQLSVEDVMEICGEDGVNFNESELRRIIEVALTFTESVLGPVRLAYESGRREVWGRITAFPFMVAQRCEVTVDKLVGINRLKRGHRATMAGLAACRVYELYRREYRAQLERRRFVGMVAQIPGLTQTSPGHYVTTIAQFEKDWYVNSSPEAKKTRSRLAREPESLKLGRSKLASDLLASRRRSPMVAVVQFQKTEQTVTDYIAQFDAFADALLGPMPSGRVQDSVNAVPSTSKTSRPPLFVTGFVEDVETLIMIDSGSSLSMMSKDYYDEYFPTVRIARDSSDAAKCITGNTVQIIGIVNMTVWIGGYPTPVEFNVTPHNGFEVLLGRAWLDDSGETTLSTGRGYITVRPEKNPGEEVRPEAVQVPLWPKVEVGWSRATVQETTVVPKRTLRYVNVASEVNYPTKRDCVFEQLDAFVDDTGLLTQRIVCTVGGSGNAVQTLAPIMNFTNADVTIPRGMHVGSFEMVDEICGGRKTIQTKEEREEFLAKVRVNTIRAHNGEVIVDSSGNPEFSEVYTLPAGVTIDAEMEIHEQYMLARLLQEKSVAFSAGDWDMGECNRLEFAIETGDARPVRQNPRRLSFAHKQRVDEYLKAGLAQKLIEPSRSPWAHNLVVVKKKGGPDRVCVDYRPVNEVTKDDSYPLPRIDDTLDRLSGCTRFTGLDLKSGYNQIRMAESSKEKTAFVTEKGLFQYTRLPFGLKNAPAACQRLMEEIMAGLNWHILLLYIDDVIVFSKTFEDHMVRLGTVLDRFIESGLKLSGKKCQFVKTEIVFLGHVVSADGVKPDPANIAKLLAIPQPRTRSDVHSFLGVANYYRPYGGAEYARITEPLTRLTRKEQPFIWTAETEEAFQTVREKLGSPTVIQAFPDFTKEFFMRTDASQYCIGAVLEQERDKGIRGCICAASRTLTTAERKYPAVEREAMAIAFGFERFEPIVYGHFVTVETDHKPLIPWSKRPAIKNARMHNLWYETLQQFRFRLIYIPGPENVSADFFSRPNDPDERDGFYHYDVEDGTRRFIDGQINMELVERLQRADEARGGHLAGMFEENYEDELKSDIRAANRARKKRERLERSDAASVERAVTMDENDGEPLAVPSDDPLAELPFEQTGDPGSFAAHNLQLPADINAVLPAINIEPSTPADTSLAAVDAEDLAPLAQRIADIVDRIASGVESDSEDDAEETVGEPIHHEEEMQCYRVPSFIPSGPRVNAMMTRAQMRKQAVEDSYKTGTIFQEEQPADPTWMCGICQLVCREGVEAVACDKCMYWTHAKCADISREQLEELNAEDRPYLCFRCEPQESVWEMAKDYVSDHNILTDSLVDGTLNDPLVIEGEWPPARVRQLQLEDPQMGPILQFLLDETLPVKLATARLVERQSEYYEINNGMLFHNAVEPMFKRAAELRQQLCAPKPMRRPLLYAAHDSKLGGGHLGTEKVYPKISLRFYWPRMLSTIREYIATCEDCQRRKGPARQTVAPMKSIPVGNVGERWEVDLMGPLGRRPTPRKNLYVCVFIDSYSKWVVGVPMKDKSAASVARVFLHDIFCKFGAPKELQSDLGTEFINSTMREVCRMLKVQPRNSTPHRPQTNGMVERMNRTLARIMSMYVDKQHRRWDEELPYALFAYNTAQQASTGVTPFMAMYGREARWSMLNEFEIDTAVGWTAQSFLDEQLQTIKAATAMVEDNIKKAQERQKFYHDRSKALLQPLKVGTLVWLHSPVIVADQIRKLAWLWHGPFTVVRSYGTLNYGIVRPDNIGDEQKVHRERLWEVKQRNEKEMFGHGDMIHGEYIDAVNIHPVVPEAIYIPADIGERQGHVVIPRGPVQVGDGPMDISTRADVREGIELAKALAMQAALGINLIFMVAGKKTLTPEEWEAGRKAEEDLLCGPNPLTGRQIMELTMGKEEADKAMAYRKAAGLKGYPAGYGPFPEEDGDWYTDSDGDESPDELEGNWVHSLKTEAGSVAMQVCVAGPTGGYDHMGKFVPGKDKCSDTTITVVGRGSIEVEVKTTTPRADGSGHDVTTIMSGATCTPVTAKEADETACVTSEEVQVANGIFMVMDPQLLKGDTEEKGEAHQQCSHKPDCQNCGATRASRAAQRGATAFGLIFDSDDEDELVPPVNRNCSRQPECWGCGDPSDPRPAQRGDVDLYQADASTTSGPEPTRRTFAQAARGYSPTTTSFRRSAGALMAARSPMGPQSLEDRRKAAVDREHREAGGEIRSLRDWATQARLNVTGMGTARWSEEESQQAAARQRVWARERDDLANNNTPGQECNCDPLARFSQIGANSCVHCREWPGHALRRLNATPNAHPHEDFSDRSRWFFNPITGEPLDRSMERLRLQGEVESHAQSSSRIRKFANAFRVNPAVPIPLPFHAEETDDTHEPTPVWWPSVNMVIVVPPESGTPAEPESSVSNDVGAISHSASVSTAETPTTDAIAGNSAGLDVDSVSGVENFPMPSIDQQHETTVRCGPFRLSDLSTGYNHPEDMVEARDFSLISVASISDAKSFLLPSACDQVDSEVQFGNPHVNNSSAVCAQPEGMDETGSSPPAERSEENLVPFQPDELEEVGEQRAESPVQASTVGTPPFVPDYDDFSPSYVPPSPTTTPGAQSEPYSPGSYAPQPPYSPHRYVPGAVSLITASYAMADVPSPMTPDRRSSPSPSSYDILSPTSRRLAEVQLVSSEFANLHRDLHAPLPLQQSIPSGSPATVYTPSRYSDALSVQSEEESNISQFRSASVDSAMSGVSARSSESGDTETRPNVRLSDSPIYIAGTQPAWQWRGIPPNSRGKIEPINDVREFHAYCDQVELAFAMRSPVTVELMPGYYVKDLFGNPLFSRYVGVLTPAAMGNWQTFRQELATRLSIAYGADVWGPDVLHVERDVINLAPGNLMAELRDHLPNHSRIVTSAWNAVASIFKHDSWYFLPSALWGIRPTPIRPDLFRPFGEDPCRAPECVLHPTLRTAEGLFGCLESALPGDDRRGCELMWGLKLLYKRGLEAGVVDAVGRTPERERDSKTAPNSEVYCYAFDDVWIESSRFGLRAVPPGELLEQLRVKLAGLDTEGHTIMEELRGRWTANGYGTQERIHPSIREDWYAGEVAENLTPRLQDWDFGTCLVTRRGAARTQPSGVTTDATMRGGLESG